MHVHIHGNSKKVFKEIKKEGIVNSRLRDVLEVCKSSGRPLRDYDILKKLFPDSDDMNLVRPRISELHELGHLIEGPSALSISGRSVRTSIAKDTEHQQTLF
jgi:hypothetical protein